MKNEMNAAKGDKALKKLQKAELKSIYEELKQQKMRYKKAKFLPTRVPGGVKLTLSLPDIFTSDIAVDSKQQKLVCKVESSPPKVPSALDKSIGGEELKPSIFECDLWFNLNVTNARMDWAELEVDKNTDKGENTFSITILSKNGKRRNWLNQAEIFAKYKTGKWFGF